MPAVTVKLHRPLISAVEDALKSIFVEGTNADDTVRHLLVTHRQWGSRDRRWVAETIYEVVRWWRLFAFTTGQDYLQPASVNWRDIIAVCLLRSEVDILNPELLELTDHNRKDWLEKLNAPLPLEVATSFPDWLCELAQQELGDKWLETANALNAPADVFLRTNILKTTREMLLTKLSEAGVAVESDDRAPDAIRLDGRSNVTALTAFKNGEFEVQDIASQQVAHYCKVKPKMLIADVCAGAGGKTLHLAALTENKADIIASDLQESRLTILKQRAGQAGATKIKIVPLNQMTVYKGKCDVVLVDAPCSGTGVIRRQPDTKWKLTPEKLATYQQAQQEIMSQHCELVKPGGKLVYATCSILNAENEAQVQQFLQQHPDFKLKEEHRFWPQDGYDGFYIAVLLRKK
jgi:16S rRNA (cytosine967-C5)-methyltransferase